ncbi:hypothetical protein NQX30_05620 [Candidatus Persebacteraceae bacterium Df01]|jgi:hypothetical protein|uniref:Uncharacterized protein n=1 Tax=Candidatus Doriopsillibacter californiensis TaxID=2970740 RepID=A0ABT7QMB2_9GAMM|nr:hypothetical protein [Candidatus Persebacteraceae bacterium Df01]
MTNKNKKIRHWAQTNIFWDGALIKKGEEIPENKTKSKDFERLIKGKSIWSDKVAEEKKPASKPSIASGV